jgi:hypothetical protein
MFDRDRAIAQLVQVLTTLGWTPPDRNVLDLIDDGAILTVQRAATICGVTSQAMLDWIADAARMRCPFARKGHTWMIDTEKLLAYVEKHRGGKPARVKAEEQLAYWLPRWSQAAELSDDVKGRKAG